MLTLTKNDITLQQEATDKTTAIKAIAKQLTEKGLVAEKYVDGMLNREQQNSTFLGNGIAIPHGTTDTRDLVNNTGVAVHHFPQGVNWGDGNVVYVAIGIAAKSDEHLGILKQLTKVLSADGVEEKLKQAKTEADIIALLNGDVQFDADFDASLIQLLFPASDMIQMSAVAGGLLKNSGNAESKFVAELVTKEPTHLGNGLWLVSTDKGVKRSGMSIVTTANSCEFNDLPVKGLIAIASCNSSHKAFLTTIINAVSEQQQDSILSATSEQLLSMFAPSSEDVVSDVDADNTAVFKIKNAHGLHARPGAMLVAEAKKYESKITVLNLNGDGKAVNARSLMKVIALGVKHGHELQFTADGADAKEALAGIGAAISSGLGEG
ncbi:bifunctional PTS fructose transporter subunit IIA/HPr protein [Aliivibrio sp. 1S165]|uniref:fused PTS fructose transporter subunit IIA/HPr protein n=1 Tax=unclassified Aliivibrio TaxID=2645654 RepID=UPI00080E7477|nr:MULTISPECIES: fused PTS fructose transporter subunit IIA/HPr protein [unclassified Aliivibrio]OCH16030.1 bifunctional PTS fructose transporter subunit IIA/HPr protein [Aliivibrio sp. 1S165]OCH26929.1 bifunctional PTS fructose transporter subunit IIA/HPr protein [Aliivibrio sp. 1S175]